MGLLWDSHGIIVLPRDCVVKAPMGLPWDSHETSIGLLWDPRRYYVGLSCGFYENSLIR